MNQLFGINHEVQGPRWYNLSQAWINMKGWIAAAMKSLQGPLKNDMNNHCCWMHSLVSQQSIVTYTANWEILLLSCKDFFDFVNSLDTKMNNDFLHKILI